MSSAALEILLPSTKEVTDDMENKSHKGNYKGTTAMKAKNQDMAFVNDNVEDTKSATNFTSENKKTD